MKSLFTPGEHRLTLSETLGALLAEGLLAAEDARKLEVVGKLNLRANQHPLAVIAQQKFKSAKPPHKILSLEFLSEWLALATGNAFYHIDPLKIDVASVAGLVAPAYASRFMILPVEVNAREVTIATAEPFLREWEKELAQMLRLEVKRVIANPQDISRYLTEFYNLAKSIKQASKLHEGSGSGLTNLEQLVELSRMGRLEADDQHVVHIVDWLLAYAFEQRASDIHMEPRRDVGNVRFRIDGVLHQVYQIPAPVMTAVTSRIKILARMDLAEKRRPQDGRIKTRTHGGDEVELRISSMPTAFGEKIVMRIFDPDVLVRDFRELGFSDEDSSKWKSMTAQPNGIILVTGPTGSGKTTTLYSTLKQLATPEVNVSTIEDPIEMVEPSFNQMQVQHNIGLDFASGVRTLLRQDPDIIMVGEIRDQETAEMAIQAALTGHLVLSTLHTNDAPSAITRLMDIGVPPYLINATVLGVLAQRLVRTLCPHCKEKAAIDDATWQELVAPWKAPLPPFIYQAKGCLECRMTGYLGRMGIYEILTLTPNVKQVITADCDDARIRKLAYSEGMKALRISGAQKVAAGLTTPEEVISIAPLAKA